MWVDTFLPSSVNFLTNKDLKSQRLKFLEISKTTFFTYVIDLFNKHKKIKRIMSGKSNAHDKC